MAAGALSGHRKGVIFVSGGMKTCGANPSDATFLQQFTTRNINIYCPAGTRGNWKTPG